MYVQHQPTDSFITTGEAVLLHLLHQKVSGAVGFMHTVFLKLLDQNIFHLTFLLPLHF